MFLYGRKSLSLTTLPTPIPSDHHDVTSETIDIGPALFMRTMYMTCSAWSGIESRKQTMKIPTIGLPAGYPGESSLPRSPSWPHRCFQCLVLLVQDFSDASKAWQVPHAGLGPALVHYATMHDDAATLAPLQKRSLCDEDGLHGPV